MNKARIDEHKLLVSKNVVEASERLLKRVDDVVAADPKLTAKVPLDTSLSSGIILVE